MGLELLQPNDREAEGEQDQVPCHHGDNGDGGHHGDDEDGDHELVNDDRDHNLKKGGYNFRWCKDLFQTHHPHDDDDEENDEDHDDHDSDDDGYDDKMMMQGFYPDPPSSCQRLSNSSTETLGRLFNWGEVWEFIEDIVRCQLQPDDSIADTVLRL